jgi:hypothetical protein
MFPAMVSSMVLTVLQSNRNWSFLLVLCPVFLLVLFCPSFGPFFLFGPFSWSFPVVLYSYRSYLMIFFLAFFRPFYWPFSFPSSWSFLLTLPHGSFALFFLTVLLFVILPPGLFFWFPQLVLFVVLPRGPVS